MKMFSTKAKLFLILQCASASVLASNLSDSHISVDLTQLSRDSGKSIVYLNNNGGSNNSRGDDTAIASTSSFSDVADLGYRLSGSKKLSGKWSLNAQLLHSKMSKKNSFSDPSGQFEIIYSGTDQFDSAHSVQALYKSNLDAEEINAVYQYSDKTNFVFGLGHINLNEKMKITSDDTGTGGVGTYTINTGNSLYGINAGVAMSYKPSNKIGLYFIGKIGLYNNNAEQKQKLVDTSLPTRLNSGSTKETSTLTDLRIGLSYSFTEQLVMNAGYQIYSISNVALAESHFKDTQAGSNAVYSNDDITWNGFNLGLNYSF